MYSQDIRSILSSKVQVLMKSDSMWHQHIMCHWDFLV